MSTVHDKAFQLVQVCCSSADALGIRSLSCVDAIVQAGLGRVKLDSGKSFGMRMEMVAVLDSLKRISHAFVDYCAAVQSTLLPVALVTARVVNAALWENVEGSQLLLMMVSRFMRHGY